MTNKSFFIWTEVFNCGKIGKIALESFLKFHDLPVHVFGTPEDFRVLPKHKNVRFIAFPFDQRSVGSNFVSKILEQIGRIFPVLSEGSLLRSFQQGHLGTARLWAYLIKKRKERFLIHFDSDVVFRENVVDLVLEKGNSFDLVGPVRNYKNNPNNREDVRHLPDVSQTVCFGFNRTLVGKFSFRKLTQMCRGSWNPYGHSVIDFFDPVMFNILKRGGKAFFLDFDQMGGCNLEGSRKNKYAAINDFSTPFKIDFGDKLIHFSAVGSGMNIFNGKKVNIPEAYKQYALDRYALYCKTYYDEDLGVDLSSYSDLIPLLRKDFRGTES